MHNGVGSPIFRTTRARSSSPRRAAVLNYFADGVYSDSDGYMLVKPQEGGGSDPALFANSYVKKVSMPTTICKFRLFQHHRKKNHAALG